MNEMIRSALRANRGFLALSAATALLMVTHPAHADSISKKITLTAQINDAIFVSKPDGSTWYGTEELKPTDYTQGEFTTTLPVRVWTKNADFNVSLAQPLKMSNGSYEMTNPSIAFSSTAGDKEITFGSVQKVTQTLKGADGYDEVHDVKISVKAPTKVGTVSTNGSYSGDLVMLFEPVAASGGSQ